jgi:hypothetical protein
VEALVKAGADLTTKDKVNAAVLNNFYCNLTMERAELFFVVTTRMVIRRLLRRPEGATLLWWRR